MRYLFSMGQFLLGRSSFGICTLLALLVLTLPGILIGQDGLSDHDGGIHLTISASGMRLIKVCLAGPLGDDKKLVVQTTRHILEHDLRQSSRFELVRAKPTLVRMMRSKSKEVLVQTKRGGADVFVIWNASTDGKDFTFKGEVKDSRSAKKIFSRSFTVPMVQQRAVLHQFVDEIALMLSGKSGTAHCKIAFVSDWTGAKELFTADYDGQNMRQRTKLQGIVLSPAYSPRGDKIAFIRFADGGPILSILDAVSGRIDDVLSSRGIVASPAWSLDGTRIAMSISKLGNSDIYLFDVATEALTRLTHSRSIETSPTFAPNGRSIAFTSDRTGRPQIYVMSIDGSGLRRLTFEGKHNESPAWSPDGSLIAYTALHGNAFKLRLIGPNGDGPYAVVAKPSNGESPAWSPDGQKLIFSAIDRGPHSALYLVNRDGSGLTKVISILGNCTEPSWSP